VVIAAMVMTVVWTGAAAAAPPTMATSSWEAAVVDGEIVGGDRSIVVFNPTDRTLSDHVIDITGVPCDCVVLDKTGPGDIRGDHWLLPDIEPGASVEIELVYGPPTTTSVVAASTDIEVWMFILVAVLATMGIVGRRATDAAGLQPA